MRSIYNQKGTLKSACQLSNIITNNGNEIKLCIPEDAVPFLYFRFQTKKFKLRDITDSLINSYDNEIFPGIYLRKIEHKDTLKRLTNKMFQRKLYLVTNENKRDFFQVCSELEEAEAEYHNGEIISTIMEKINPQSVEQPGNLGGGQCGGCPVYSYFNCLGILGEHDINGYYFFRDEEAIEATKKENYFIEMCKNSTCFNTYKKILNEGYSQILEERYQIKVSYRNGKYYADEGKHRVCVMRRFGYTEEIPMLVTRISESWGESRVLYKRAFSDNKYVVQSCYGTYERLGISSEDVRELLKNPDATIVDYLKRSKYSYEEMMSVR